MTVDHLTIMSDLVSSLQEQCERSCEGLPRNIPHASFLLRGFCGRSYSVTPRRCDVSNMPLDSGVLFRLSDGKSCYEAVTTEMTRAGIEKLVADHCREYGSTVSGNSDPNLRRSSARERHHYRGEVPVGLVPVSDKIGDCRDLVAMVMGFDTAVNSVSLSARERQEVTLYVDADRVLFQAIEVVSASITVFVERNGDRQYATWSTGGAGGWERLSVEKDELRQTVETALMFCGAKPLASGFYDIIADPQTTGIIAHESFGHGVEADMFVHDRARAASWLNRSIGSPLVTIVDNPSLPGHGGSYFFDDEGELSRETIIVDKGIFRQALTDFHSAHELGFPSTPNGRRAGLSRKAYARMSNTFFQPGEGSVEDLIAGVDSGIYLLDPWNGMEDPLGWGLQVDNHFAREIKGGKFTGRCFSPIVMTGTVPDILSSITGAAGDFDTMDTGSCGKGHKEYLRVGLGGSHIRCRARLG